ncbi:serpentine type 7TM GPCR chemoreceptor srh domain-containing protein [Ditylenchus destructor]|uniref:Serpentine type 7TM GPCR chemoreceptor srh domain-containing protein n=1 Tax=Ditylenchus destructor TaxID=166010 RepID=A0AAD4MMV1_9BILA|nr:serpentine type 7TM GPCR chemoreceptor srh domain-containing protein [Ditylenchus destructor]
MDSDNDSDNLSCNSSPGRISLPGFSKLQIKLMLERKNTKPVLFFESYKDHFSKIFYDVNGEESEAIKTGPLNYIVCKYCGELLQLKSEHHKRHVDRCSKAPKKELLPETGKSELDSLCGSDDAILQSLGASAMLALNKYIIFNAISCAGFDLIYGLVHPEPVFPLTIVMSGGLLKHWIIPTYMSYFILYAAFISICGILYSMPLLFLYRYLQTVNSRFLKLFTLGLRSFLLCSAGFCVLFVPPYITIGNVITSQSDLKEFLRVNQPKIYSIAHNRSILGIENPKNAWIYFLYCWVAIVSLILFATLTYCVYGCYSSMQRKKSAFSTRTLQLYRSLVNALMIDLVVCGVMAILPIWICAISLYYQVKWASTATLLALSFSSWYPCVSHIILMWFITPYRRALVRMFKWWKKRGKTEQNRNSNFLHLSTFSN